MTDTSNHLTRFAETGPAYQDFLKEQRILPDGEPRWRGIVDHVGRLVLTLGRFEETYAIYGAAGDYSLVRFEDPLAVLDPEIEYGMDYVWDGHLIVDGVMTIEEAFDAFREDLRHPFEPGRTP